ncbi:MAG: recombination protein O N-terminal domain-containing protein, partial [Nevskia sp.]|nr:recombination protein O N-terminal domain-containing protein [Nevskia sp.]
MTRYRIEFEPAYLLAQRPYRESSQLLEVFSRNHGRVGLVARGARGPRSRLRGVLQLFTPLLLSWSESGELGTLG